MVPATNGNFDKKLRETGVYACTPLLLDVVSGVHKCIVNTSCTQVICDGACLTE